MIEHKILVVDDEQDIQQLAKAYLVGHGFKVLVASNGKEAINLAREAKPDLIILDILLPDITGFEVCTILRKQLIFMPIIFVSCCADEKDKILGLGLGADDYLTKPFSPAELVARVNANLRRFKKFTRTAQQHVINYPGMEIDITSYTVKTFDKVINLSTKEFEILFLLASHPNQVFTYEQIYNKIWGFDATGDTRTVSVHVSKLREKIERHYEIPMYIQTVWGKGYKFQVEKLTVLPEH